MANKPEPNNDFEIEVLISSGDRAAAVYNDFFVNSGIIKKTALKYDVKPDLYDDPYAGELYCEFLELLEHAGVEIR